VVVILASVASADFFFDRVIGGIDRQSDPIDASFCFLQEIAVDQRAVGYDGYGESQFLAVLTALDQVGIHQRFAADEVDLLDTLVESQILEDRPPFFERARCLHHALGETETAMVVAGTADVDVRRAEVVLCPVDSVSFHRAENAALSVRSSPMTIL